LVSVQEFYRKLSDQERNIFHITLAFVVLAMFDMLFLRPFLSKLSEYDNEIFEKTNSIKQDVRFLSYREKIMMERKEFSVYETGEAMEVDKLIASFLETIELIASKAKINLVKLNPSEVTPKKGFVLYYANLECSGKLSDIVTFIHNIDVTNNLLKVVKINMTGKKASAEEVNVSMKVAKLVIDPKTIGNYEFAGDDIEMPEDILEQTIAMDKMGNLEAGTAEEGKGKYGGRAGGSTGSSGVPGKSSGTAGGTGGPGAEGTGSGGTGGTGGPGAEGTGSGGTGGTGSGSGAGTTGGGGTGETSGTGGGGGAGGRGSGGGTGTTGGGGGAGSAGGGGTGSGSGAGSAGGGSGAGTAGGGGGVGGGGTGGTGGPGAEGTGSGGTGGARGSGDKGTGGSGAGSGVSGSMGGAGGSGGRRISGSGTGGTAGGARGSSSSSSSSSDQNFQLSTDDGRRTIPSSPKETADARLEQQKREEQEQKELTEAQKKLQNVKGGGRVEVKSFEQLIADFFNWGGKKDDAKDAEVELPGNYAPSTQEADDKNLWQKKFGGD